MSVIEVEATELVAQDEPVGAQAPALIETLADTIESRMPVDRAASQWAHDLLNEPGANHDTALELMGRILEDTLGACRDPFKHIGIAHKWLSIAEFAAKLRRRAAVQMAELEILGECISPNDVTEPEATP